MGAWHRSFQLPNSAPSHLDHNPTWRPPKEAKLQKILFRSSAAGNVEFNEHFFLNGLGRTKKVRAKQIFTFSLRPQGRPQLPAGLGSGQCLVEADKLVKVDAAVLVSVSKRELLQGEGLNVRGLNTILQANLGHSAALNASVLIGLASSYRRCYQSYRIRLRPTRSPDNIEPSFPGFSTRTCQEAEVCQHAAQLLEL